MKCPKCNYLGFETGDRCKNCGYDFSLIEEPEFRMELDLDVDLAFRDSDDTLPATVQWNDNFNQLDADAAVDTASLAESPATLEIAHPEPFSKPEPPREVPARVERKMRSFGSSLFDEDEPLVKLPPTPRAPLAVRRTPEAPRLHAVPRPVPKPSRPIEAAPALDFVEEAGVAVAESGSDGHVSPPPPRAVVHPSHVDVSGAGARFCAAVIDHLLLAAIDIAVVYFTLRMTGLTMAEFSLLPIAPLAVFLLLVKLSYFCAFTAVGGQTIGKMAMRIRVVTADDEAVDGTLALKRTLAGVASAATLGLGFLPALIGGDRRALHDRLTRTRVVTFPSA